MARIPFPGEYVLLRRPGRSDWPAMICTDDMAPQDLQRPSGYLTLVLLIEKELSFYYAPSAEIFEFVPVGGHHDKELQAAHDRVLDQMDSPRATLDYWRLRIEQQRRFCAPPLTTLSPSPSPSSGYIFDQGSEIDEVEIAKRLSLCEWKRTKKRPRASPSPSRTSKKAADLRNRFRPVEKENTAKLTEMETRRYRPENKDFIDGDLSSSGEMIKVYVGAHNDEFLIPRAEIERLPFLSDAKIGCIAVMEDGTSRLDLQCLTEFDPDHFRFVAEFLSTGQFGHTVINEETRQAVLEECAVAWPIADRIVLEDMLDYIVTKVQQAQLREWEEAWVVGLTVYETSGTPLGAYKLMKELLVKVIATNFLEKVYEYGDEIIGRLRDLPELQRDVYRILLETAEHQVNEIGL